jgi:hypothetical protein
MKYLTLILLLLTFACGKPASESATSTDSLSWDTASTVRPVELSTTSENTEYESVESYSDSLGSELEYENEYMVNNAWQGLLSYAGEYVLESSSEAEDGSSLSLTHVDRFIFSISITKMVADFCSGTISGEINLDHFPTATFDGGGHPVTITLKEGKIEVQDPERQLGVGTCDYNGTFVNINAD